MHGNAAVKDGYAAKWRGAELVLDDYGVLQQPHGSTRVDLRDGRVHWCSGMVLTIAARQVISCRYDGWAYDPTTGYSVAWYGKDEPYFRHNTTVPTISFDDYTEVVMAPYGVATMDPLVVGQLQFDCSHPRSLTRRNAKARRACSFAGGNSGLYVWRRPLAEAQLE
jgi:hypothetical protein